MIIGPLIHLTLGWARCAARTTAHMSAHAFSIRKGKMKTGFIPIKLEKFVDKNY